MNITARTSRRNLMATTTKETGSMGSKKAKESNISLTVQSTLAVIRLEISKATANLLFPMETTMKATSIKTRSEGKASMFGRARRSTQGNSISG